MLQLLATLAVGAAVGYILFKLKIPGGFMVGAIIGVSCLTILTGFSLMPYAGKQAAQIVAGAFIGCSVEKEELLRLRHIYKPAGFMLAALLLLNVTMGLIICAMTPLDLLTSFLCAVPGGISEVPLMASDMGADPAKVAVMQFARMVVGVGIFPSLIAWLNRKDDPIIKESGKAVKTVSGSVSGAAASAPEITSRAGGEHGIAENPNAKLRPASQKPFFTAAACAIICGLLGLISPIPSGTLLLPTLGIIGLKLLRIPVHLPRRMRRGAQVLAGSYIGCSVTYQDLLDLRQLAVPVIILLAGYVLNSYLCGRVLRRYFGLTLKQGMLATSPAGASDIALISADIGAQSADVVILQVLRMLAAVSVFPYIMQFIAKLIGG